MRAVVVGPEGEASLEDVGEPDGAGTLVRVLACGLCGSDVEKLQPAFAGTRVIGGAVAEGLFARGLCLPSGSSLTPAAQDRVIATIAALHRRVA